MNNMNKNNNQKNTLCHRNAQLWYYVNAVNKYKNTKNIYEKQKQMKIIKYYLNGRNL